MLEGFGERTCGVIPVSRNGQQVVDAKLEGIEVQADLELLELLQLSPVWVKRALLWGHSYGLFVVVI
jgi:hypothetical protein